MKLIVLDYETLPIQQRPHYPPEPVSFSLKLPEWRAPKFFAWGHRTGRNNISRQDAANVLKSAYQRVDESTHLLCFNTKFDADVSETHFGLKIPPWHLWHDAMFLLFLEDPHQRQLDLKSAAARLLNQPAEERDVLVDWVLSHKRQLETDFPEIVSVYGGIKPSTAKAFVAYTPPELAGPYANGDSTRTLALFNLLHKRVCVERGMRAAYDRERQVMPILLRNEREGLRVDVTRMEEDQKALEAGQAKADAWLRRALKAPGLDLDKDAEVAKALHAADAVTQWSTTPTGRLSVSKKALKLAHFRDKRVASAYSYRQRCATVLETFLRPWQAYGAGGRMHTTWNQVRQSKGAADTGGTRTGRPSSDHPNFLNMPKPFAEGGVTEYLYPAHIAGLPQLPRVRSYILPDERGHWIGRRDFNQQELRILAHFEDGDLLASYLENPRLDVHEFVRQRIEEAIGLDVGRSVTKTINFGYIYGQGLGSLAERLDKTVDEMRGIRNAQMLAVPGLKKLSEGIKARSARGLPIVTWGGREYYTEPAKVIDGILRRFEYKLLNYLIQGSAADVTKESLIRYDSVRREGRLMLTVYDENNISGPKKALSGEMLILRDAMMSIELDVPLISDGEIGPDLGNLSALKEPAPNLARWGI